MKVNSERIRTGSRNWVIGTTSEGGMQLCLFFEDKLAVTKCMAWMRKPVSKDDSVGNIWPKGKIVCDTTGSHLIRLTMEENLTAQLESCRHCDGDVATVPYWNGFCAQS